VNGAEQAPGKVYTEKTTTSIEFVPQKLRAGDEVRVYYIPNTLSLGDIKVVGVHTDLDYLKDVDYNSIALSVADKKFYIYKGSRGWEEFILPFTSQNVGVLFIYERQVITDPTQRLIELKDITYTMGASSILVFVDDKLIDPALYTEVSSQSILFNDDLPIDLTRLRISNHSEEVTVETTGQRIVDLNTPYVPGANNLAVTVNGIEQALGKAYIEKTSTSLEFIANWLRAGDEVRVSYMTDNLEATDIIHEIEVVAGNTDTWEDSNSHTVTYQYDSNDSIISELIMVGANTVRTTAFGYDGDGNIILETIYKGNKTIEKAYTYDGRGNIVNINVLIT
jgi:hypothetical protein